MNRGKPRFHGSVFGCISNAYAKSPDCYIQPNRGLLARLCARLPRLKDEQPSKLLEEAQFKEMEEALRKYVPHLMRNPSYMDFDQPDLYSGPGQWAEVYLKEYPMEPVFTIHH